MKLYIDEGGWKAKVDYGYDDAMEELEFDIVSLEPREPSLFEQIIEIMNSIARVNDYEKIRTFTDWWKPSEVEVLKKYYGFAVEGKLMEREVKY